jgi:hypothetical protein
MRNEPLIVWEKWIDPFGKEMDDAKWIDYESDIDQFDNIDMEEDELEEFEQNLVSNRKEIKVIATPMGLMPYNELTAPGKLFNFWIGHTNFNITPVITKTIEEAEGVEILDIFTRYRFRIGVGKCFNDSETMKNINDQIYTQLLLSSNKDI